MILQFKMYFFLFTYLEFLYLEIFLDSTIQNILKKIHFGLYNPEFYNSIENTF